ncbi:MAG: hypothetical protein IJF84_13515 [Thermoguttaceae bacterium]|nr:hypothetical protein [Thermoguttaceae bacterium]
MNFDRFCYKVKSEQGWWLGFMVSEWKECLSELRTHPQMEYATARAETLCQCTGLRDSNGRRIYENDIIRTTDEEGKTAEFVVKYNERDMSYEADGKTALFPLPFVKFYIERGIKWEVVGNTWDKEPENEQGNN